MSSLRRAITALDAVKNPSNLFSHHHHHLCFPFSTHSWLSTPGKPLLPWPPPNPHSTSTPPPTQSEAITSPPSPPSVAEATSDDPSALQRDAATISHLLTKPFSGPSDLEAALDRTGIEPDPLLFQAVLRTSEPSPNPALALFRWARSRPAFHSTPALLTSLVDLLGKSRSFDAAWSLLIDDPSDDEVSAVPADACVALIRRYARSGMPQSAIRTFEFMCSSGPPPPPCPDAAVDPLDHLIDALCKEGLTKAASEYMDRRKVAEPGWVPTIRSYNILLNGWFRSRKLRKAEQVWEEIRRENVQPTVVTYGTMIEGLCRMRRVDQAIGLLEEMRRAGIEPNAITCNPIVDAFSEAGRFKEALGTLEKLPIYGVSPNIATYNSLVKGFCKNRDLVGASKILKTMIGRGILPTSTTYNYFFRFFAKSGKIEEGMNLYTKMIMSGYAPDRLTYQLLIKMLCEKERLDLAVQVIKEMNQNGFDLDLATSSMLVHLLCRMHRFEEACVEFEGMIMKGIVPQYLTYKRLVKDLKRLGRLEMARKISDLMSSVLHSTKLPNTYRERDWEESVELRKSIMMKAQVMSDALKTCRDNKKELSKLKGSSESAVESANRLITDIKRRVYAV